VCEESSECSGTSACKIQMPGNYPEENLHHTASFTRGGSGGRGIYNTVVCKKMDNKLYEKH
jgi:hypothetical protein